MPFWADWRPTLLGESIVDLSYSWGVKVSWSCSSAELTLVPGGQSDCTVRTILIAPVSVGEEGL